MNRSCFLCNQPANKVCKHPDCNRNPFFCNEFCAKFTFERTHIHNQTKDVVSFEQFQNRVTQINNMTDPHTFNKKHLEQVKKKSAIIKAEFIQSLDEMVEAYQKDLSERFQLELSKNILEILTKVHQNEDESLSGKQIRLLFNNQGILNNQQQIRYLMERLKESVIDNLNHLQSYKCEYFSYSQLADRMQQLQNQAMLLKSNGKFQQAIAKFEQYKKLNSSNYLVFYRIGICLSKLNKFQQAEQNYKHCLSLNPNFYCALNQIGVLRIKKKDLRKAIEWFTKFIATGDEDQNVFANRGYCYYQLKKYQQALTDYKKALKIRPGVRQFINMEVKIKNQIDKFQEDQYHD